MPEASKNTANGATPDVRLARLAIIVVAVEVSGPDAVMDPATPVVTVVTHPASGPPAGAQVPAKGPKAPTNAKVMLPAVPGVTETTVTAPSNVVVPLMLIVVPAMMSVGTGPVMVAVPPTLEKEPGNTVAAVQVAAGGDSVVEAPANVNVKPVPVTPLTMNVPL